MRNDKNNNFELDLKNPPVALVNNSTGVIIDCNDTFSDLTKFSKDELVGLHRDRDWETVSMQSIITPVEL